MQRVAISELYRGVGGPTAIRCRMAFPDFIACHVLIDHEDAERERAKAEAERGH